MTVHPSQVAGGRFGVLLYPAPCCCNLQHQLRAAVAACCCFLVITTPTSYFSGNRTVARICCCWVQKLLIAHTSAYHFSWIVVILLLCAYTVIVQRFVWWKKEEIALSSFFFPFSHIFFLFEWKYATCGILLNLCNAFEWCNQISAMLLFFQSTARWGITSLTLSHLESILRSHRHLYLSEFIIRSWYSWLPQLHWLHSIVFVRIMLLLIRENNTVRRCVVLYDCEYICLIMYKIKRLKSGCARVIGSSKIIILIQCLILQEKISFFPWTKT